MENRKKIVVLDGYTLCARELNFDALREFGEVTVYDRVAQEDVAARIGDAQIVLTNKALITADVMDACPRMEYVGVTATGYNVVDAAEGPIVILASGVSFASWGFFYPVHVHPEGNGSKIVVGISSKVFQIGPVVTRAHEKCVQAIEATLSVPVARIA